MQSGESSPSERVGGFGRGDRVWVVLLFVGAGVALGLLLPLILRWTADLPWMPFEGPLRLLGSFDETWLVWGRPLIGAAVGAALALWTIVNTPVLHLDAGQITVRRHGEVVRVIPRDKVDAVHRRGSKIVIENATGRVLFSDEVEGDKAAIARAFLDAGYPWEGPAPDSRHDA